MPIPSPSWCSVLTYVLPPLPMGTYLTWKPSSRHARSVSTSKSSSSAVTNSVGVLCANDSQPLLSARYWSAMRLSRLTGDGVGWEARGGTWEWGKVWEVASSARKTESSDRSQLRGNLLVHRTLPAGSRGPTSRAPSAALGSTWIRHVMALSLGLLHPFVSTLHLGPLCSHNAHKNGRL